MKTINVLQKITVLVALMTAIALVDKPSVDFGEGWTAFLLTWLVALQIAYGLIVSDKINKNKEDLK